MSVDAIAIERELSPDTVMGHLSSYYLNGGDIDLNRLISQKELKQILPVLQVQPEPYKLKPIFEQLNEEVSYGKIKLAIAYFEKTGSRI